MNIFYLDEDPEVAAIVQYNKHVVKMILESAQMLCTAHHCYGDREQKENVPYKQAHLNHPSTIWARRSRATYMWLYEHMLALGHEYTHRYGKVHSCQTAMNAAEKVFEEKTGKTLLCHKEATPFAFAGPDEFKYDTSIDTLTAYKRYISSKPWAASNYLRDPSKKPNWL